jgi:hypothetical protein
MPIDIQELDISGSAPPLPAAAPAQPAQAEPDRLRDQHALRQHLVAMQHQAARLAAD